MELQPRLLDVAVPDAPTGVVLVLHGGASRRSEMRVSPTQLSVLRMLPIARRITRHDRSLAVFRVLNSRRGWDTHHTPVEDARWALGQVRERFPDIPACFVGHSLGGRAALLAVAEPGVRGAVALAPWVYPGDVPAGLRDRRIRIVHGDRDRIASPQRAQALARALAPHADVEFVVVAGGKHAMLRHGRRFGTLAATFAGEILAGAQPQPPR